MLAKNLTDEHQNLKKRSSDLAAKFKDLEATGQSALFEDLKTQGAVKCLDDIPQIHDLRKISEEIAQTVPPAMEQGKS